MCCNISSKGSILKLNKNQVDSKPIKTLKLVFFFYLPLFLMIFMMGDIGQHPEKRSLNGTRVLQDQSFVAYKAC